MKKNIMIVLLVFTVLVFSGCNQNSKELDFEKPFTEKQVVNVLEENLGKLSKVTRDIKDEDKIEGIAPLFYHLEDDEALIYIYVFDSLSERKKVSLGGFFDNIYPANNILVKYVYTENSIEAFKKSGEIKNVVLTKLNPYEEISFFGSSKNWNGYYKIGFYEYFSNDDKGTLIHEAWSIKEGKAVYKKEDINPSEPVTYSIYLSEQESSSGETYLNNQEVSFGIGGGNTANSKDTEEVVVKIQWMCQEETIVLKKNDVKIKYEVKEEVPKIVKEMAFDYTRMDLENYNSFENEKVVDAKIIGLTKLETGTASENHDIQMWLLEYRILSESSEPLLLAGGMILDDGWRTEQSSAGQPIIVVFHQEENDLWKKIGITNTGNVNEEHQNDYSEAAIAMYEKFVLK